MLRSIYGRNEIGIKSFGLISIQIEYSKKENLMNSGFNSQHDPFASSTHMQFVAQASADTRMNFIRKTYALFLAGVLMAVAMGALCLNVAPVANIAITILRNPILAIALILGGSIGAQAVSRVEGLNYLALFGFTGLMGLIFAPIVAMYAPSVVGQAAFLSIVIFGGLTAYSLTTRKDFSYLGGMLFVGIWAIVIAGIANVFWFKNSGMEYWLAWGTLFISSGFVLYKTSNMLHVYGERDYCAAALGLFISFFNIFMSLLRILGGSRR